MTEKHIKPRVGTMAIGCCNYWGQFPGMREYLVSKHNEFLGKFRFDVQIVEAGMVDTIERSAEAGRRFAENDVDIVFVQAMTYAPSGTVVPAIKDLNVPVIVFNIQETEALDFKNVKHLDDWLGHGCTCACVPELTAMLIRYGLRFDVVTGCLRGDAQVDSDIRKWCEAASVRRKMRSSSIGILGRQYHGMLDLYCDENVLVKQFGMMTYFLMWEDVVKYAGMVTSEEKEANIEKLRGVFDIPASVGQEELDNIGYMYGGFMRLAEEHNISILANHFEKETVGKEIDMIAALNPANTLMIKDGIACVCEGDIKCGVAMLIMKLVAGSANLSELYTMDFKNDVIILGHSGASDPDIADSKPVLKTTGVFHGKSGKGFTTQAIPRIGPITIAAVSMKPDNNFKMIVAEGNVEDGEILNLGDTNCRVRFNMPLREFVNKWCITGPSHHAVMGGGNHIDTLEAVAKVLGMDIEIVARNNG